MKLYIQSSISDNDIDAAIKGYTAQGGQYASKYPFTPLFNSLLYKYVSETEYVTHCNLYRKFDLSEKDKSDFFNKLYRDDSIEVSFDRLTSFTKDKHRAFTYGGGIYLDYILFIIPPDVTIHGDDISDRSIYPEEEEVLLGKNKFIAYYSELQWTHSNNMIITLHSHRTMHRGEQ